MAIAGVALLVCGAVLTAAGVAGAGVLAAVFVAGAALVGVAALRSGYDARSLWRNRAGRRGADAFIATLLLTAVLVVLQAISLRHTAQLDLTRNHRNTLSPQTLSLLGSLDRDVTATAFVRQTSTTRAGVTELLDLYARRSPRFRYRLVDPDRQPDLTERLHAAPDEIVLEAGDRRSTARNPGEESLTSALIHVTREQEKAVYFVTGHGEKNIANTDRDGYSAVKAGLERQGYSARPLSLVGATVPGDAAVVVIAGPRDDYLAEEVNALGDYARTGGSFLVLVDPRTNVPRLAALLAGYRLSLRDEVILDEKGVRAGDRTFDATVVKVRRYERHPITRAFNYVTMFPRARPVFILPDSTVIGITVQYLAVSDDGSWGETDMSGFATGKASRDGVDIAGPLPLAAVATRKPFGETDARTSRLVLVGDSDFANNVFYGVLGNSDWFANAVSFLAHDETLISIRPREALGDQVYLTDREGRLVFLICIVLLPAVSLGAGVVVIAKRARL
ncbi:MAG TPA: GldG family protein [Candidatus Krumholzibacteria bacterium]